MVKAGVYWPAFSNRGTLSSFGRAQIHGWSGFFKPSVRLVYNGYRTINHYEAFQMHFLIAVSHQGHKLIDFGDEVLRLKNAMLDFTNHNVGQQPVILNEKMTRETFLCDEYGIPVKDDGFLIKLDDL